MTDSFTFPELGQTWTIDDLERLPDDGMRYELVDGSLLVSPPPPMPHGRACNLLREVLAAQAPPGIKVGQDLGVTVRGPRTYFIPDVVVLRASAYDRDGYLEPGDVLLVVEVLSPSNRGTDLVTKRHYYAADGIARYWLVDHAARTLTVLELDGETYREAAVVEPGTTWEAEHPFPLAVDPADFL